MSHILEKKYRLDLLFSEEFLEKEEEPKTEKQNIQIVYCQTIGSREEVELTNFPAPQFEWRG